MPTPEQVRQLPELVRVRVPKEWEDLNGHVNVKHHLTMYDLTNDPLLDCSASVRNGFARSGSACSTSSTTSGS